MIIMPAFILNKECNVMKQKKFFSSVTILFCLLTACAENGASSDDRKENELSGVLADAFTKGDDIRGILSKGLSSKAIPSKGIWSEEIQTKTLPDRVDTAICVPPVSLNFFTEEQYTKAADDTVICIKRLHYPVVTIAENENAANKINEDIRERVNTSRIDTFVLDSAIDREQWDADYFYYFDNFYDEFLFIPTRMDSKVISFLTVSNSYTGGDHNHARLIGLNYDTQTGKRIELTDLSEHTDAFAQDIHTFIQDFIDTSPYFQSSIAWGTDIADLEKWIYTDDEWYFSTSGLVFSSDPYEFDVSEIKTTVLYSDLEEFGLKEKYSDVGRRTIPLQEGESFFWDLNGDGQDEEIQYYLEWKKHEKTDIYRTADVHLIIDGTEFAADLVEFAGQLSGDENAHNRVEDCFLYEYETDMADTVTEIVFEIYYGSREGDLFPSCTFRYRYDENGTLTFLGTIEGTITDPATLFSIAAQDGVAVGQ